MMKAKSKTKNKTYEVNVAVTFFLTQKVEATDEFEAGNIAADSVDRKTIMTAWDNGDYEIESHDSEEV